MKLFEKAAAFYHDGFHPVATGSMGIFWASEASSEWTQDNRLFGVSGAGAYSARERGSSTRMNQRHATLPSFEIGSFQIAFEIACN